MIKYKLKETLVFTVVLLMYSFPAWAGDIEITELIRTALKNNADLSAANYDVTHARLNYESLIAGTLPEVSFTTSTAGNPLYKYSDSDEFSTDTFTTEHYKRHILGGGLNLGADLPTGGTLNLTGTGSLDLSIDDSDSAEWNYLVSPGISLSLRQPLFTDRTNRRLMRFDSLKLTEELVSLDLKASGLNRIALENNIIILISRKAVALNSLRNSFSLFEGRLALAEKRLELAVQDEESGRLSRLDRLSEELDIRRLEEAIIETSYHIKSTERELEQLVGGSLPGSGYISLSSAKLRADKQIDPGASFNVLYSEIGARSIELTSLTVPKGDEPVFEVSALYWRNDSDTASDLSGALNDAGKAEMNLSVSMSLSFSLIDWGESDKSRSAEEQKRLAAAERIAAARETAKLASLSGMGDLELIAQKIELLKKGLEYDKTLLEREIVRLEAGLSTEAAVETVKLELLEREYTIKQLEDEKILTILQLFNTGGKELKQFFTGETAG